MKKTILFALLVFVFGSIQAQWVNDPVNNTLIANCESSSGEILVAASPNHGTFVQWTSMSENGWSPKLQYLNHEGIPQWGRDGIHITTPNIATWSPGYAIAALSDNSLVSMFRTADAHHWVVKVNPDGSTPWGTDGMVLFNGEGGGRSELLAGDDGGFWALGTDMDNSFLQYVNADGSLRTMATITDPTKKCSNGKLVPSDDIVFVVYSKHTIQGYTNYNKEIYVAGYNKDGELVYPETLLFELQTINSSYIHYAISDGMGGGYVYQWHNAIGGVYNIYVTHFDASGTPTITDPNGITVHSFDPSNYYINAYPTIDWHTNDLLLVYRQTDSYSQSQYKIYINRITSIGERPWNEGILVADHGTTQCGDFSIDAFKYFDGFAVFYQKSVPGLYGQTVEAHGFDTDGNMTWSTQLCSNTYPKTLGENTQGYDQAQNVVVWVNSQDGNLYGQNIGEEGEMGDINMPPPLPCCFEPDNFDGYYLYNEETSTFGAMLTWESPTYDVLHYNLYRQPVDNNGDEEIIVIDSETTSYFDEIPPGTYKYQLTAMYEDEESGFANTPYGEDYLLIEVTSASEDYNAEIHEIVKVFTISGQPVRKVDTEALSRGIYILQGLTADGKLVTRKVVVNQQ